MSGKLHRALVQLASIVAMISGIVVVTDPSKLGIAPETWQTIGGWVAFGAGILASVVTVIRGDQIPYVTTGVGNETPVTTTTLEVKEISP